MPIEFKLTLEEAVARRLRDREDSVRGAYERCEVDVGKMRRGAELLRELQELLPDECLERNDVCSQWGYEGARVQLVDSDEARAAVVRLIKSHLRETGKSIKDEKTGEIYVWLQAARRPELLFFYVTRLKPGDPCQIVEETRVERHLLCEVPR